MALAIGLLLLVALFSSLFRLGPSIDDRSANPMLGRVDGEPGPDRLDLTHLRRDMAAARLDPPLPKVTAPESAAEVREAELGRQLLEGTNAAASYRQLMSDLAHDSARAGGRR